MANLSDFPAKGRVREAKPGSVVFLPSNTNYELHLQTPGTTYDGPVDEPIEAMIRLQARKVYTVPSGGNFIQPIVGPPRIVQGRVRHVEEGRLVVQAGTVFVVELPPSDDAIDLARGPIGAGSLVNVVALPGATFELLKPATV